MKKINEKALVRIALLLIADVLIIQCSVMLSLFLRFELHIDSLRYSGFIDHFFKLTPVYTVSTLVLFALFRLYTSLWKYAGIDELRNICASALISNLCLFILNLQIQLQYDNYLKKL